MPTTADRRPSPRPRTQRTATAPAEPEAPKPDRSAGCNVPRCTEAPEWRGLCPAHRQTHRGLADPKETP